MARRSPWRRRRRILRRLMCNDLNARVGGEVWLSELGNGDVAVFFTPTDRQVAGFVHGHALSPTHPER